MDLRWIFPFWMFGQPTAGLNCKRCTSCELVLRPRLHVRGRLVPTEFFPQSLPLTFWTLSSAMFSRTIRLWLAISMFPLIRSRDGVGPWLANYLGLTSFWTLGTQTQLLSLRLCIWVDSTQFLVDFGKAYESSLIGHGGSHFRSAVPPGFCGRAQFLSPRAFQSSLPTPRPSRQGEKKSRRQDIWLVDFVNGSNSWGDCNLCFTTFVLIALCSGCCGIPPLDLASIRKSSGCHGGFAASWTFRPIRLQGVITQLPHILPTRAQLEDIYLDFRVNYRSFESWHLQGRSQVVRQMHSESMGKAFKEVIGKPALCIGHFGQRSSATLTEVETGTFHVRLDRPLVRVWALVPSRSHSGWGWTVPRRFWLHHWLTGDACGSPSILGGALA